MKKLLAIMMASVLCLFLFTACGGNSEEASGEAAPAEAAAAWAVPGPRRNVTWKNL